MNLILLNFEHTRTTKKIQTSGKKSSIKRFEPSNTKQQNAAKLCFVHCFRLSGGGFDSRVNN